MLASLALLLPSMLPDSARLTSARSRSGNPSMGVLDDVDNWLTKNVGPIAKKSGVGGGSGWSTCTRYAIEGSDRELFVKASGSRNLESMFLGEALGLKALGVSGSLAIPEVLHYADGTDAGSYIIMEYLDIGGRPDPEAFGRAMASLHLAEPRDEEARAGKFGFPVDNTIGATPQPNPWTDDWVEFFREKRIGHQVRLARDARMRKEWERTLEATDGLKTLFEGINVKPSVLHGDLWSGNIAAVDGKPCIYDPAVYYGHHEAEWGMSWCASLPPAFWKGYRELIPEDEGFTKRSNLYELYHKLNHYNLFGGGYYNDALGLMSSLDD